ncbi:hypothetical protein KI387_044448, partial [Taxus chinensis]
KVPRDPIRYRQDEAERDLPSRVIADLLEEVGDPWDSAENVGVGEGFVEFMIEAWPDQVVEERAELGLDEDEA